MAAEESPTEEVDEEIHTEGVGQQQEDEPPTVTVTTRCIRQIYATSTCSTVTQTLDATQKRRAIAATKTT